MITIKLDDIAHLRQFIGTAQLRVILKGTMGEEGEHFRDKLTEYGERIKTMPKTYEQEELGDAAVVHLHYFTGGCDWWITEKDCDPDGEGQIQAFGLASLGYEPELGYISIAELLANGAELDLYWTPRTLAEVKADIQAGLEFEAEPQETPQEAPDLAGDTPAPGEARSTEEAGTNPSREAKRRSELEAQHFGLAVQCQGPAPGAQADLFGAAGLDRKPAGKLRHGGGELLT